MNPITVALVDDHRVVGRSLKGFLESFPEFTVVGLSDSGEDLLAHLLDWRPQVVIVDLLLPGGIDGIETTRRILKRLPSTKVVALTASLDEARMVGVLAAGATGYVRKDAEPETLLAAIRAVARGKTYIDPSAAATTPALSSHDGLTARELDVLRHLAQGRSNKEIGDKLGVTEQTVKTHVGNILEKLGVDNRAQAIVEGLKRGLVTLEAFG